MRLHFSLLLALGLLVSQTQAIQLISTNTFTVSEGELLSDECWVQTLEAEVAGTLQNDLFLYAQNRAVLGGTFEHNVWCAVGDIRKNSIIDLTGTVKHNTRLMGATVRISGQAGGNLMVMANTIKQSTNSTVRGDAVLMGNSVILGGTTEGNISITASRSATISGTVGGNVDIVAPEIILQRNARIEGNLTYTSGKELVPAEGIVSGNLKRAIAPTPAAFSMARLNIHLMWFLAALLVGIPFIALFPMTTAMASQLVRTSPGKCLWVGALCVLALPMLGIMSLPSGIGTPLGLLILGSWAFLAYTSHIIMGLVIGTLLLRRKATTINQVLLAMAGGLGIIYAATLAPAISLSIWVVVISMGTGSLLLSLVQKRRLMIQVPEELKHLEELKNKNTTNEQEEK